MDRFFSKIKIANSGCWEWIAGIRGKTGYGAFKLEGKVIDAHRLSFIIHKGFIPTGFMVCHTCDNKVCVNPDHLILGTPKDNYDDGIKRGRIVVNKNEHLKKHPSRGAYLRGCRCKDCRNINAERSRAFRQKK